MWDKHRERWGVVNVVETIPRAKGESKPGSILGLLRAYGLRVRLGVKLEGREREKDRQRSEFRAMADWGPVIIGVVLFILLTPGLLFQLPGGHRTIEFSTFHTSGKSIVVHSIIFFGLFTLFTIVIGVHIYTG
eukprot:Gb_39072 [translate_table: standard]